MSVWQTKSARPLIVAKEVFDRQIMDLSWCVTFFPHMSSISSIRDFLFISHVSERVHQTHSSLVLLLTVGHGMGSPSTRHRPMARLPCLTLTRKNSRESHRILFKNSTSLGLTHAKHFGPLMPKPAIAFALMMVTLSDSPSRSCGVTDRNMNWSKWSCARM